MDQNTFVEKLAQRGIELTPEQLDQFEKYYDILVEWNQKMNLTAITDKEAVYLKHFYDSLTIAFDFDFTNQKIVDVGAGAGFPSIPLKIAFPQLEVTIVDSLSKRITFLEHLFKELNLDKVKAVAARSEDYASGHREQADIVMARAVARLNILDELCLPLVKVGGHFLSLKGRQVNEEIEEARHGITVLGGEIDSVVEFNLANQDDLRGNIIIKKIKATPNKYPRQFGQIKKKPL
ncbi:MAG: 16S rRNA (guanine(527)-N(7))-methyltransferase RsmG [Erysipelotrichaceae bacterium]|nr:16S rRNA (guanine(527)-N(7))-methyltransferase RsmG [Erysipelotrichaceae bacterium]